MKVLVLTNMYPTPDRPFHGTFVEQQVKSLRREGVEIDLCEFRGFVEQVRATNMTLVVVYHDYCITTGYVQKVKELLGDMRVREIIVEKSKIL